MKYVYSLILFFAFVAGSQAQITGSDMVCPGYRYAYSAAIPGATTYSWSLPQGWTIAGPQNTNSINANVNQNVGSVCVIGYAAAGVPIDSNYVIVDWMLKDTTVETEGLQMRNALVFSNAAEFSGSGIATSTNTAPQGIAGSTSRFGIVNNFLYAVTTSTLHAFNITTPSMPLLVNTNEIGRNIETIFSFNNTLFIGSQTGMFIYNLNNPVSPQQESMFAHVRQCDPVIADQQFAYVTLRNGTECGGFSNQLEVVNVQNLAAPFLVKTLPLTNPRGLSKDGALLFICDGEAGLRILNASVPANVSVSQTIAAGVANDVIAMNNVAYVVSESGLFIFDYAGYPSVSPLGKINFNR